ncbi:hypothetical protein [Sphingomonas sp. RB1R13]|uniref:hypothetical protein n=1 Tax=Sphingomonas sp. RB1R13 TaxID=3096159 RepID=UPI002FCA2502
MNSIKLLAAIAALGLVATPAMSQSTNTMSNSMGGMSSGSMGKGSMDKGMMHKGMGSKSHMMPMNHAGMSKKTIAMCHKMSHSRMMKSRTCSKMMKHGKMMKHAM